MKIQLPSGARLLLDPMPGAPVVAICLWLTAGSCEELPGEHGGLHFLEHMLFKGTPRWPGGEAVRRVESLGGDINAFTGYDDMALYATVPAAAFAETFEILADMLLHCRIDPEDVALEREVILDEIAGDEDEASRVLQDLVNAAVFREHPLGRPISGTAKSLRALDAPALRRLHDRLLRPTRLIASLSGGFDPAEARALAERLFPGEGRPEPRLPRAPEPEQREPRLSVVEGQFEETLLELAFPGVPHDHPDAPALELLLLALGGGPASALGVALQIEGGLALDVWGASAPERDAGLLRLGCEPLPGKLVPALSRLLEVVHAARAGLPGRERLNRARAQILGERLWQAESASARAHDRAEAEDFFGDPDATRRPDGVDRLALARVAEQYLRPERASLAVLMPKKAASRAEIRALLHAERPRPAPPAPKPITRAVLDGGLTVVVEPLDGPPVVALCAVALGGQLAERRGNAGIGELWARSIGAEGFDTRRLAEWLDLRASTLDGQAGPNTLGLRMEIPADRLDEGVELFSELLLAPRFSDEDVARALAELNEELRTRDDNPEVLAQLSAAAMLFGAHPYGLPAHGDGRSLNGLDARALQAHHRRLITRDNLVIGVAGSIDAEPVLAQLGRRLRGLRPGPARLGARPRPRWPLRARARALPSDRQQAHVVQLWRGARFSDPDAEALALAATILGGQSGRLFTALRERLGLAYYVGAESQDGWDTGALSASIAMLPERAREGAARMRAEVQRLAGEGPSPEELERARQSQLGSLAISRQRSAFRAWELACWDRYGRDARGCRAQNERLLAEVTPESVRRALAARMDGGVEVMVGADP